MTDEPYSSVATHAGKGTAEREDKIMPTTYETIIFLQGDDYDEAMRECGAYVPGDPAVIYTYAEQWSALFEHLRQWDYGEPTDSRSDVAPWGTFDETDDSHDGYVVAWNSLMGYCSLTRVIAESAES